MFIGVGWGQGNITVAHTSPVGSSCFLSNEAGSDEMPPSTCSGEGEAEGGVSSWGRRQRGKQVWDAHLWRMRFQRCMLR